MLQIAPQITITDKYIAKQILAGLFVVSSVLLGIAWFTQILRLISYIINDNIGFFTFLKLTSLLFPDLLTTILPISLFAVVLFVYNKLVLDKELIVMQAAGKSTKQLIRPAINITKIVMLVCFYITLYIAPKYETKYKNFLFDSKNNVSALMLKEGEFNQIASGLTIYVKKAQNNILDEIFIHDGRNKDRTRTIMASKGMLITTDSNMIISLLNGSFEENNMGKYTFGSFDKYTADLGVIAKNYIRKKHLKEFTFFELLLAKQLGYSDKESYPKYLVELHKRLLKPLYNIIFVLVSLIAIFKSSFTKRSSSKNMLFAISGMSTIQMLYLYSFEMLRRYYKLYPLVYLLTFAAIFILYKILYYEPNNKDKI